MKITNIIQNDTKFIFTCQINYKSYKYANLFEKKIERSSKKRVLDDKNRHF